MVTFSSIQRSRCLFAVKHIVLQWLVDLYPVIDACDLARRFETFLPETYTLIQSTFPAQLHPINKGQHHDPINLGYLTAMPIGIIG